MNQTQLDIINATIACIEEFGIEKTTIRKIADKANVNSAAISYYFRSKDILINNVMDITIENAFRWDDFSYTESYPISDQLYEIFSFFAKNSLIYKNLTKAHIVQLSQQLKQQNEISNVFYTFYNKLIDQFQIKTGQPRNSSATTIMLLFSWFFSLFSFDPQLYFSFVDWDINNEEQRNRFIRLMIQKIIG